MERQIEQLSQEIQAFQTELEKLQLELNSVRAIAPEPKSNHPSDISQAYRSAAVATVEKLADVRGVEEAIDALTIQINQRQQQLKELQTVAQKQERLRRVEEARYKLRSEIKRIDDLSAALESAYFDLKSIYNESNADFKALSDTLPQDYSWHLEQLIHFHFLQVPTLVESSGSFTLSCRTVDILKAERDAQQRAQAQSARENKLAMDAQIAAYQQQKTLDKRRNERERIEEILSVKMIELNEAEARRARDMEQVARGVRLNLSGLDAFIASTNVEIEQLQKDLDAVEKNV